MEDTDEQQNSQNITCRVPIEILAAIFHSCVPEPRFSQGRHWHSFSQVCRHWRQVALHTPTPWTNIDFRNEWLTWSMLDRSKATELHLLVAYDPHRSGEFLRRMLKLAKHTIMQNLHRTASLNLCVLEPDVLSHITGPAPRLHSLHLTSRSQDSYGPMFFPGPIHAARKLETLSLERKHRGDHWNTPRIPPHNPL
ncbi:hypothetical protein PM082_006942 [Marasmius tenuissimus]|nr:hypothetical protein PM082_006942 [Marasmius tenuissimus]